MLCTMTLHPRGWLSKRDGAPHTPCAAPQRIASHQGGRACALAPVGVLPVERHVEALLVQVERGLLQALVELGAHVRLLARERLLDGRVGHRVPVKQPVHLRRAAAAAQPAPPRA